MNLLYVVVQWTWGFIQSLFGLVLLLLNKNCTHYLYHGAVVTVWNGKSSVSLGMFVFITDEPFFSKKFENQYTKEELSKRLLVHEYGHTIQSLILGPLYLVVIGMPSTLWGFLPSFNQKRHKKQLSYFSFFTEKWANTLGEMVTHEKSMEQLVID